MFVHLSVSFVHRKTVTASIQTSDRWPRNKQVLLLNQFVRGKLFTQVINTFIDVLERKIMERADRARDLSDKRDTRVSSEIIRSSLFGMRYLSDKRDTRVSYITR